jgi:hypothetical protein
MDCIIIGSDDRTLECVYSEILTSCVLTRASYGPPLSYYIVNTGYALHTITRLSTTTVYAN